MKLTKEQAIEVIKSPASKKQISAAKEQESQLRVFTEDMDLDELNDELYWPKFKARMKARLNSKKFKRVFDFARYPLPTIEITDSILSDFFKVFDGKNRNFHIDGDRDISLLNKWVIETNLEKWIEEHARSVFKSKPCSFVVIDRDKNGKPYPLLIESSRLIDAKFKSAKGDLEYIVFTHSVVDNVTYISLYDDETYWVFSTTGGGDYTLVSEAKHQIGYTPAVAFISSASNSKNYFKRRVAFTKSLSKLEDWTQFDIYRNFVDHYAPFPVTESPIRSCPNPDCEDGVISISEVLDPSKPEEETIKYSTCEICAERNSDNVGPGTHIGIKVKPEKDQDDGRGVFKMIFPDVDKLEYTPKKLDGLELEIRHKTVGLNYMDSTNEAMNEMQLSGSFASMESVLIRTKNEMDILYKWMVITAARIYYKEINVRVDANFGTEYYLVTEDDLQKRYKAAKEMGLPQEEQLMIYLQLIDTKYKGNPNKVERQKMLIRLDPLPLYDLKDIIQLRDKMIIDAQTLSFKANFVNFVARFENENAPITQFGLNIPPEKRLLKIREELDRYNAELMAKIKAEPVKPPEPAKV